MTAEMIEERLLGAGDNITVTKRACLWRLIAEMSADLSGRIEIVRDKQIGRMVKMCGLKHVNAGWMAPTLIADATLDHRLLKPVWPQLKSFEPITVALPPAVVVRQVVDRSFAKSKIAHGDDAQRLNWARRILAVTLREALRVGGKALLITHMLVEDVIRQNYHVPPWLELTHYGAVTGLDRWGDIRSLFIAGRPLPQAAEVTRQAEALFEAHIKDRDYVQADGTIPIVPDSQGNNAVMVKQCRHPDPMADLLRWQACEAGVIQAIGRARGILRTKDDPLDVLLMTDVPVPEIGPVVPALWGEIGPGLDDLMLTAGCRFENAADAARVYPDLIASAGALREDRRTRSVRFPLKGSFKSKSDTPPLQAPARDASYRRAAAGCKTTRAIFLAGFPAALPGEIEPMDARRWLESRLGPLAEFKEE
jgi:hypothetical protein